MRHIWRDRQAEAICPLNFFKVSAYLFLILAELIHIFPYLSNKGNVLSLFTINVRHENCKNLILVKYDSPNHLYLAVSSEYLQCVCTQAIYYFVGNSHYFFLQPVLSK